MRLLRGNFRLFLALATGVAVLVIGAVGNARAELTLRPEISMRLEYTDNLYLEQDNKTSEVIGMLAPGIHLERTGKNMVLDLGYTYEKYRYFNEHSLENRSDAHIGSLKGSFLPKRAFSIGLRGEANREVIDRRVSDGDDPLYANTTNRITGQVRPCYRFTPFSRTHGEVAYSYTVVYYDDPAADDTDSHAGELLLAQGVTRHTELQLFGAYEQVHAALGLDYERLQGKGGIEWRPDSTFMLTLLGGRARFEFEDETWDEVPLLEGRLQYLPGQRGEWGMTYRTDAAYDLLDGVYETERGTIAFAFNSRLFWQVEMFVRNDDYLRVDRQEQERGGGLVTTYRLLPRLKVSVRGDQRWLKFAPVDEKVKRFSAGTTLTYTPSDYVGIDCSYRFRSNDSDLDGNDYMENRVLVTLRLGYAITTDGRAKDVRGILQSAQ